MKLNQEMKACIRAQREAGYPVYNFFTTKYPFSTVRFLLVLLLSIAIGGGAFLAVFGVFRVVQLSPDDSTRIFGQFIGGIIASSAFKSAAPFLSVLGLGVPALLIITAGLLARTLRTLTINLFKEAVELIGDPFPYFLRRKRYLLSSDIESVDIRVDRTGRWVDITLAGGEKVPLLVRTEYDDEESARTILETIQKNIVREKKKKDAAGAPEWKVRLAELADYREFDDIDEEEKLDLMRNILEEVARAFGEKKIVAGEGSDTIELRTGHKGFPVRIMLDGNASPKIEAKPGLPKGSIQISTCADEDLPSLRDAGDPWSENEDLRVFLVRGVFVDDMGGDDPEEDDAFAAISSLPAGVYDAIVGAMRDEKNPIVMIDADTGSISAETFNIFNLDEPVRDITQAAKFMGDIAAMLSTATPAVAKGFTLEACVKCGTRYLASADLKCPNCGASLTASSGSVLKK